MATKLPFARRDPTFDQTGPFHHKVGSAKPGTVHARRVSELNTQRFAAGSRSGGSAAGQGPQIDAK